MQNGKINREVLKSSFSPTRVGVGKLVAVFLMGSLVAASNYWVKVPINRWITWGSFFYPFTFFVTELTNYTYGSITARRVVYAGFGVAVLFSLSVSDFRIGLASTSAFLMSQLLDIHIFSNLRNRSWWIAPAIASVLATFLDSFLFFSIAFGGTTFPWITVAIGTFFTKGLIDLSLLLPFRMVMNFQRNRFRAQEGIKKGKHRGASLFTS